MTEPSGNTVENINGQIKPSPVVEKINNLSIEWGIMLTIQDNLNLRIGSTTWKKYISAAFWNYISTPINFTITLFTAFTAGQTGTETIYLSRNSMFYLLMTTFLLSVINTFFKLKEKAVLNYNACNQYNKFGSQFEEIYFTPIRSDKDVIERLNKYKELQGKINAYNEEENVENVNYLTTILYYFVKNCFKNRMKRINKDERFWLLDGKPNNPFYPRNRYNVDVEDYFKENFDFASRVDENNLYIKFNYETREIENPEPFHFFPNIFIRHTINDDDDKGIQLTNKSMKRKKTKKMLTPKKQENSNNSNNSNSKKEALTEVDEDNEYEPSIESTIDSEDCRETVTIDV